MSKWDILTQEVCSDLFELSDGGIRWKVGKNKGQLAGSKDSGGYLQVDLRIRFNDPRLLVGVHQVVFMIDKGFVPDRIDHEDGNKLNNSPGNLREISASHNALNSATPVTNTSGYKGVVFEKDRQKWRGRFTYEGKRYVTSRVNTPEEAHELLELRRREVIPNYSKIVVANR